MNKKNNAIKRYIEEAAPAPGGLTPGQQSFINYGNMATAGSNMAMLGTMAVGWAFNAGNAISKLVRNIQYDRKGCDQETEPQRVQECKQRMLQQEVQERVNALTRLIRDCDKANNKEQCEEQIRGRIDQERQRLYGN